MLQCIDCGAAVSWPVSLERLRRGEQPSEAPQPGTVRVLLDSALNEIYVTALESSRVNTTKRLKQPRDCTNGHYVAKARTVPHAPPYQVEYDATRVEPRAIDEFGAG
ncbi:MAG: hypothetical protein GY925_25365 [Actinomycetia bacterium]|nr:hypothetical protein [Actinomycetes bacterium]